MYRSFRRIGMLSLALMAGCALWAQKPQYQIFVEPEAPRLDVGKSLQLTARVMDEKGKELKGEKVYFYSRDRRIAEVNESGLVTAHKGGEARLIVLRPGSEGRYTRQDLTVQVHFPDLAEIQLKDVPATLYAGTHHPLKAEGIDVFGDVRPDLEIRFSSSDPAIAGVNELQVIQAHQPGTVTLTGVAEEVEVSQVIRVLPNPVKKLEILSPYTSVRTGDVVAFQVRALDEGGAEVADAPLTFSFQGRATNPSYTAGGMIEQDGRFVAYEPGMYTVTATCGQVAAAYSLKVEPRNIQREVEFVGRGAVNQVHTSDLWVWEGVDGRDYSVTGTWGADGEAYFWDVTDPANIQPVDTFQVDARTVNDVKVSEDGKVCILSREGASNRKNGIVILDVTNPRDVQLLSTFDEGLTGGVHNLFIYQNHVYALSNGERYDIINIENPRKPRKVGSFELDTPGHAIHDVWVVDGIAYSSNWSDGVQLVDVGNGIKGGSPSNPVKIASYAYPSGWNHAAFPFRSPSTGKFYVIAGDEAFPTGIHVRNKPTYAAGYLHVIDFTDPEHPREVAHYEVPGAGSHNFWVEGETLYVANYNAGLRILDISGDLMGDLFKQEREIGKFIPSDPEGHIPNAPFTWGPQPHKGHIFFSDWNSGLWSVRMKPVEEKTN